LNFFNNGDKKMRNDKQKGFTLVELAIVLVIIGLIVSSILVGQDMIRSAELRSTVSQYRNIQTGVAAFKNKYSYIPGDIEGEIYGFEGLTAYQNNSADCSAINPSVAVGTGTGDQNGIIESSCGGNATFTGEMVTFWSHLTTPGKELIAGSFDGDNTDVNLTNRGVGVTLPAMKFGGSGWGAYGADGNNFIVMGVSYADTAGTIQRDYPLTAVDAHNIDEKIDDGFPNDGFVRAGDKADSTTSGNDINVDTLPSSASGDCMVDVNQDSKYAFAQTDPGCVLQFVLNTFN
jgi:prepilin-type N-terminal cleavage/methylation domain-containing protein